MRTRAPAWAWIVGIVLGSAFCAGLTMANYRFAQLAPGGNDFLARWVGAHAWVVDGVNPYDPSVSLTAQRIIYGRPADRSKGEDLAHFAYPLPAMVFFAPFGLLPYPAARAVWMTLLEIGLPILAVMGILLARWRPPPGLLAVLMLFSVVWYHGLRAIVIGQFAVIEALLLVGALLAIQRRRDGLAGLLLALSISKPQMSFLLIPGILFWSIRSRRWWLPGSALVWFVVLLGGSLAIMPDWPLRWLRQLVEYPEYTGTGSPVSILLDAVPRFPDWLLLAVSLALVVYAFWEWVLAGKGADRPFQWAAGLTLVVTNLVALRTATTNYVVLLPVLCLVFGVWSERLGRRHIAPVVGVLSLLGVGLWALFLLTVEGNLESPAMYLPLPLLGLLGLIWVRWWARREPRFPLESAPRSPAVRR